MHLISNTKKIDRNQCYIGILYLFGIMRYVLLNCFKRLMCALNKSMKVQYCIYMHSIFRDQIHFDVERF